MVTLCNFELSQWLFVHHFSWCSLPKRLSKVRSAILQILSLIVILNSSASSSSLSSQLWSSILMSSTAKKNYTHKSSVKIVLTMLNDFETLFCIGLRAHTSTTGNLIIINYDSFFKKIGKPQPLLSFIFGLFKQTSSQFLQQICEKCPCSIRRQESNPLPLEHESPPMTTRPGIPVLRQSPYNWKVQLFAVDLPMRKNKLKQRSSLWVVHSKVLRFRQPKILHMRFNDLSYHTPYNNLLRLSTVTVITNS